MNCDDDQRFVRLNFQIFQKSPIGQIDLSQNLDKMIFFLAISNKDSLQWVNHELTKWKNKIQRKRKYECGKEKFESMKCKDNRDLFVHRPKYGFSSSFANLLCTKKNWFDDDMLIMLSIYVEFAISKFLSNIHYIEYEHCVWSKWKNFVTYRNDKNRNTNDIVSSLGCKHRGSCRCCW